MQNKSTISAILLVLAIVAILIWTILFYKKLDNQVPELNTWIEAAKLVKTEYKPGDKVAIVPFWATMGEKAFAESRLDYMYLRFVAEEDWPTAKRLWVVSGYDRFLDRDKLIEAGNKPDFNKQIGPLTVERFVMNDFSSKVFDLHENLPDAEVFYQRDKKKTPCQGWIRKDSRFTCSNADWQNVGWMTQEIGDAVRKTIWSHPVTNTEVHIKYRNVGADKKVVLFTGLTLYGAADDTGLPVHVDIKVDGKKIGRATQENKTGWHRHEFSLKKVAGNLHDIEFVVTTERDGRRHFSFNGYVK